MLYCREAGGSATAWCDAVAALRQLTPELRAAAEETVCHYKPSINCERAGCLPDFVRAACGLANSNASRLQTGETPRNLRLLIPF